MTASTSTGGFSAQERAAMKQRSKELQEEAARPRGGKKAAEELDVLTAIAAMADGDREIAERIHLIVTTTAPELSPKLWYGQPAYARKGTVVCFFRSGQGDKERYSTFGFSTEAALDHECGLWPTAYAVTELTEQAADTIAALVRQAVA
ncbi:DUF1801 domain-containing protein [Aquipuribacter sp. MA13-6]|uniref:DUF1801 domain-containing protein n=1 Tax=unclassified Aquipuribacter TaxID=2635084 RepID=UPI003EEB29B9